MENKIKQKIINVGKVKESRNARKLARAIATAPLLAAAGTSLPSEAQESEKPKYSIEAEVEHNAEASSTISRYEKNIRATENIMDYFRPAVPLHHRTNKVGAIEAKLDHNNERTNLVLDSALFPVGLLEKAGINARGYLPSSLWIGGGYEIGDNRFIGKAGIKLFDKLEIYGTKKEGEKPYALVGIYTDF